MSKPRLASFFGPNAEVYSAQEYDAIATRLEEAENRLRSALDRCSCDIDPRCQECKADRAWLTTITADKGTADQPSEGQS